jgi:predicted O-methyltransferase YrrM
MKATAIEGWMNDDELRWLARQAAGAGVVVEIGVWRGRSTACLAEHCRGLVIAIDHFLGDADTAPYFDDRPDGLRRECLRNLAEFVQGGRLLILEKPSREAAPIVAELLRHRLADMVFIDGDHSVQGTLTDIVDYLPLLRHGGLLCGHDIDFPSVRRAVDLAAPGWRQGPGHIWYRHKPY